MKRKKQKLIKNIIFVVIFFLIPIMIKFLNLNTLELVVVTLLIKCIDKIYSNFISVKYILILSQNMF